MIRNGRDIPNGATVSTQVCIIGSGPAGITAAWELQKAGINVVLIEGSRVYETLEQSWPDKVLLYNGKAVGQFASNEPEFLILRYREHQGNANERERTYGGTSTHWGGQSRPEDPIDLEARPPHFPGWPVTRKELDPYYARASKLMHLYGDFDGGKNFSNGFWEKELQAEAPQLNGFWVEMYQFVGGPYKDFATRDFDGKTIGETSVDVILNASLLEIDHQGGHVSKLRVASMNTSNPPKKATEFTIKADAYVLACGAVANARQLLLSKVGNDHVGRYFMGHPLTPGEVIRTNHYLCDAQARMMNGQTPTGDWTNRDGVGVTGRFIPNADMLRKRNIGRCWFWYVWGQYYFEMAPNPNSRVTLADSLDPVFRQRQTHIDWQLSDVDRRTYETTTQLFKAAVAEMYGGQVSFSPWEQVKRQLVINGHHLGTTRMSDKPDAGVVDKNLKVHDINNLFVAGSSVFPSGGISNPTFTIIMLSIRLADHLRGLVK
jgi:choline dehydrogenase-like flavoprotein